MAKEKQDEVASVTYDCKTPKGYPFKITATLINGCGFKYGNHNGVVISEDSGHKYLIDVRYDRDYDTAEGFYDNIFEILEARYEIGEAKLIDKQ